MAPQAQKQMEIVAASTPVQAVQGGRPGSTQMAGLPWRPQQQAGGFRHCQFVRRERNVL